MGSNPFRPTNLTIMNKFKIGNVIKTKYDHVEIVIEVKDEYINTIFMDSSNSSAGHKFEDYKINKRCYCFGYGLASGCKDCKGTGEYEKTIYGYKHATLLASDVKQYILDRLTKNFEF